MKNAMDLEDESERRDRTISAAAEARREPVAYRYNGLNQDFIKMLAEIADYAREKYGSAEQYANSRLAGDKSPINHIYEHLRQYQTGEPHDHFKDPIYHLAVIAYNAMMEALYHRRFGHKISPLNLRTYKPGEYMPGTVARNIDKVIDDLQLASESSWNDAPKTGRECLNYKPRIMRDTTDQQYTEDQGAD